MARVERLTFMRPTAASTHAAEVKLKDVERKALAAQVAEFLKTHNIPKLATRKASPIERPVFNNSIAVTPTRRAAAAIDKEKLHAAIAEFSCVEIEGITLIRSAYEVSALLRKRGFKLLSPSVKRIAESIGIQLNK